MKSSGIHPEAEAELWEAAGHYEWEKPGLGAAFRAAFEDAAIRIREHPRRWSPRGPEARRYLLRRFPYAVIYVDLPHAVFIVAVAHNKRHPDYWKHRL